jgi:A/G-specific adenine glycosylase
VAFSERLIAWQRRHGRNDLPWQGTRDPYRIWLSEVMLQQTQVSAAIPYYRRFLERFPAIESLARAEEDEVLRLWSGLGYYARGRNLLAAAREIAASGQFPDNLEGLCALPGVGRSTAAAIAVFAFGRRAAILDGNVKRVLSRVFATEGEAALWRLAERLLPKKNLETYTQALMDLGATVCLRKPKCEACPVAPQCVARKEKRIHELPAARARKMLPTRRATWFVFIHGGAVLLERRPSRGLWGGLWTFPEARVLKSARAVKLVPIEHGFTHFRLIAQPLVHRLRRRVESPGRLWLDLADAVQAAVPAPVRTVLKSL